MKTTPPCEEIQGGVCLCIDPGPTLSGYVTIENNNIISFGKSPNKEIRSLKHERRIKTVLIEYPDSVHGKIGHHFVSMCVELGRFKEAFSFNIPILIGRKEVLSFFGLKKDSDVVNFLKGRGIKLFKDSWQAYILYLYYKEKILI